MKYAILAALALTASVSAFAETAATPAQIKLLCKAADALLEKEQADAAVDMKLCQAVNLMIVHSADGAKQVIGRIPLNTPNHPSTTTCQIYYSGTIKNGVATQGMSDAQCMAQ